MVPHMTFLILLCLSQPSVTVGVLTELSWADWIDKSGRQSSLIHSSQALCDYFKNSLSSLVPVRNLKEVGKNVNFSRFMFSSSCCTFTTKNGKNLLSLW